MKAWSGLLTQKPGEASLCRRQLWGWPHIGWFQQFAKEKEERRLKAGGCKETRFCLNVHDEARTPAKLRTRSGLGESHVSLWCWPAFPLGRTVEQSSGTERPPVHALGIFPTQGSNLGPPHCRWIFYQLSQKGSPRIPEWVAYCFSSEFSWPRNRISWTQENQGLLHCRQILYQLSYWGFCFKFIQLLTFEYSFAPKKINVLITIFWNRDNYQNYRWTFIFSYHNTSTVLIKRLEVISI